MCLEKCHQIVLQNIYLFSKIRVLLQYLALIFRYQRDFWEILGKCLFSSTWRLFITNSTKIGRFQFFNILMRKRSYFCLILIPHTFLWHEKWRRYRILPKKNSRGAEGAAKILKNCLFSKSDAFSESKIEKRPNPGSPPSNRSLVWTNFFSFFAK